MSVGDKFARLVSDDELCAKVRQAVEGGDEDALRRLGFGGFGDYAQRLSELMSDSVREGHDPQAEDFAAIMEEVARPVHYAHRLVNEAGTAVQLAKDEPLGIHMKPIETDFDDEAFRSTVGNAASMGTPEKTVEALADGLGYFVKKTGNDFIKANAEAHSRAGFEVKVKRSGSAKCCPWCAARIGSWAIANAPDGVFGCHANCSCTVEYTSGTGAVSQRRGTGRFVEVDYQPPHVMSREEAREKGGFDKPKRLTGREKSGTINLRYLGSRNMPNGLRTPRNHVLTESEIKSLKEDIISIGADLSVFKFNEGLRTGYDDVLDEIRVKGDILPDLNSNHPRDRMSSRAALAHEYYGHRAYRGTKVPNGAWNDEFRASYTAAKNCPNLSDAERRDLVLDALERAKESGVAIKYNDFIRRTLYGY